MALFRLATWIEARVPADVDLTAFDLSKEWETPADILRFLERHDSGG